MINGVRDVMKLSSASLQHISGRITFISMLVMGAYRLCQGGGSFPQSSGA